MFSVVMAENPSLLGINNKDEIDLMTHSNEQFSKVEHSLGII